MKRLSLLITLVSAIGVMGIASSSASADVLCDTWGYTSASTTYCPAGHKYQAGTKLNAYLSPGKKAVLTWNGPSSPELSCSQSTLEMELENPGSFVEYARATVKGITFTSCNTTTTVLSTGEAAFDEDPVGTWNARAQFFGDSIQYKSPLFGVKCTFALPAGVIHGPSWTGNGESELIFKGAAESCEIPMSFTATYKFATPAAIYAAQY